MRFFWRIFLSAWIIIVLATVLTVWASGWLPKAGDGSSDAAAVDRLMTLIARDLRRQLATDPTGAADVITRDYALDLYPLLQIYVLGPDSRDVQGRELPEDVVDVVRTRAGSAAAAVAPLPKHMHLREDGLGGYLIVGREGQFPLRGVVTRREGRALLLTLLLLSSAAVSLLLARFIVLPVRRLHLAEQKVAGGDLTVRVAHTIGNRTDDIARLARDFDVMTERVDALLQSRHRLLRDVSHELRSPLARLQALLSITRQRAGPAETGQIDRMETELERLDELIGEILTYSRLEAQEAVARRPTDIVDLVQNIVDDASLEGQASAKVLNLQGPARCVVDVDSGLVQRAVENVVRNALKYTVRGTAVDVRVVDDARFVRIVIDDHGPGVPQEALGKIFEPFYRVEDSRSTRSGSGGIGLSIAERAIRLHGGTIAAHNRDGGGLSIEITLPRAS